MAATTAAASPLADAIEAATKFKLLLDAQPAGALFNPCCGGDARESVSYALASLLLAQSILAEKTTSQPPSHGQDQVDLLMEVAFGADRIREKRSPAYMEGARSYLELRATGAELPCRYETGTAEFDAYFAGLDEGREIWRSQMRKDPA